MTKTYRPKGDGSIYQDAATGRWVGQLDLGRDPVTDKRIRRKVTGSTKKEVADKLKIAGREHDSGLDASKRKPTVAEVAEQWLALGAPSIRKERKEAGSLTSLTWVVRSKVIPGVGRHRIDELKPDHVEAWLRSQVASGVTTRYLRNQRDALRQLLNWAVRRKLVRDAYAVTTAVVPEGATSAPKTIFTPDEHERFFIAIAGHRLEAYWTLQADLGLRPGETDGLMWSDLDLDEGLVSIERALKRADNGKAIGMGPPKTAKSQRTLALTERSVRALRKWKVQQVAERLKAGAGWGAGWGDLVFTSTIGTPLNHSRVRKMLAAVCAGAELPRVVPYGLRHTVATTLAEEGFPLHEIADQLGHTDTTMVERIYRHRPAVVRTAARAETRRATS